jgi:hypothetical protein
VETPGQPTLQFNPRTGETEFVYQPQSGPQAGEKLTTPDKALTETQSKALNLGSRAWTAHLQVDELETPELAGEITAPIMNVEHYTKWSNYVLTPAQQRYIQYQIDFISAVLRKESGAVIDYKPGGEFDRERRKYFWLPGDSEQVKFQKRRARESAIKALQVETGGKKLLDLRSEALPGATAPPKDPQSPLAAGGSFKIGPDGQPYMTADDVETVRRAMEQRGTPVTAEQIMDAARKKGIRIGGPR